MIQAITERTTELEQLCRRYYVLRLEVFGSATDSQRFRSDSDLDFLVEFQPSPPCGYANAYFGLLEGLQAVFGRSVDLVSASAIKNPYFRESVEETISSIYLHYKDKGKDTGSPIRSGMTEEKEAVGLG